MGQHCSVKLEVLVATYSSGDAAGFVMGRTRRWDLSAVSLDVYVIHLKPYSLKGTDVFAVVSTE